MLDIDHVQYGAGDLDAGARRVEEALEVTMAVGGRHVGLGTANRIAPLNGPYFEVMGVVDRHEAESGPLGFLLDGPDRFVGWVVQTDDIDSHCARLGLDPVPMRRQRPDGVELSWRVAGLGDPFLPAFIQWNVPPELHPGYGGAAELAWIELAGDPAELREWLGGAELDRLRFPEGERGVTAVAVQLLRRRTGAPVRVLRRRTEG